MYDVRMCAFYVSTCVIVCVKCRYVFNGLCAAKLSLGGLNVTMWQVTHTLNMSAVSSTSWQKNIDIAPILTFPQLEHFLC